MVPRNSTHYCVLAGEGSSERFEGSVVSCDDLDFVRWVVFCCRGITGENGDYEFRMCLKGSEDTRTRMTGCLCGNEMSEMVKRCSSIGMNGTTYADDNDILDDSHGFCWLDILGYL